MKTSCTIIISHYESTSFLCACIRQIRKYARPEIRQTIYIVDQSRKKTFVEINKEFGGDSDIELVWAEPLYSGYGIDWAMRYGNINTEFICQIHADAFPVSKNWLHLPITLIKENKLSFVGQLHFIAMGKDSIYPPSPFFSMSPTFNVAKTETYKEMSLQAGFARYHNRIKSDFIYNNDDWAQWAKEDYKARGSDDDTVAFHWEDKYRQHDKLGLAISGFIESSYGRLIDDIVFHFGSCREAVNVMGLMPEGYQKYTQRINENYSNELIDEMVSLAKANKPPELEILSRNLWDGKTKTSSPPTEELNNRIEELKNVE